LALGGTETYGVVGTPLPRATEFTTSLGLGELSRTGFSILAARASPTEPAEQTEEYRKKRRVLALVAYSLIIVIPSDSYESSFGLALRSDQFT
jgi:hypothetical protein